MCGLTRCIATLGKRVKRFTALGKGALMRLSHPLGRAKFQHELSRHVHDAQSSLRAL